jgi:hypothetical protein
MDEWTAAGRTTACGRHALEPQQHDHSAPPAVRREVCARKLLRLTLAAAAEAALALSLSLGAMSSFCLSHTLTSGVLVGRPQDHFGEPACLSSNVFAGRAGGS